jgi:hypothetical protein
MQMGSPECFFHAEEVPKEVRKTWWVIVDVDLLAEWVFLSQTERTYAKANF